MLSESVLSVRKELFPQNKTAVSDMPKVNIQKKVQPTDADMVQTSLSFENIYYSLWEIAGRYSSFCQFRVIGNSHDERMIPMLEVGTGAQMIFCVAGINGTQALLPELLLKMAGEYCRAYECGWKLDEFYADILLDPDTYGVTIWRFMACIRYELNIRCEILKEFEKEYGRVDLGPKWGLNMKTGRPRKKNEVIP